MFFPPKMPTSRATPIRGSHQRRLRLHCGPWKISVLERPLDIYSNITLSIRRHRRVQVAKITWRQAGEPNLVLAVTNHEYWDPVPAPTFEELFALRLHPTVLEQLRGRLCAKLESSKRIFSSTTLDLGHVCLRLRGQMDAGVTEH